MAWPLIEVFPAGPHLLESKFRAIVKYQTVSEREIKKKTEIVKNVDAGLVEIEEKIFFLLSSLMKFCFRERKVYYENQG
jgi:hypothetical protein